ncbi:MAG: hypothetical protein HYY51_00495 [Candidatus Magasanikbacteria bacterium]|nr:hypothetical protein [Candidatus Magasanikbacteria bacterium]
MSPKIKKNEGETLPEAQEKTAAPEPKQSQKIRPHKKERSSDTGHRDGRGASIFFSLLFIMVIIAGLVFVLSQKKKETNLKREISSLENKLEIGLSDVKTQVTDLQAQREEEQKKQEEEKKKGKKYAGTLFEFSFYYPGNYSVSQVETNLDESDKEYVALMRQSDIDALKNVQMADAVPNISFHVFANPDSLSPMEWIQKNTLYSNYTEETEVNVQTIAGKEMLMYSGEGLGSFDYYVLPFEESLFLGVVWYGDENDQIRKDIVSILETLELKQ